MKEQIHIIVIGFGRSGQGAMKLAFDQSFKVTILDESTIENKHQLIERFADLTIVDQVDLSKYSCPNDVTSIVISPGIFPKSTIYKWAENSNKINSDGLGFSSIYDMNG